MPLPIDEIGIKMNVGDGDGTPPSQPPDSPPSKIQAIVAACVARVKKALRLREQR